LFLFSFNGKGGEVVLEIKEAHPECNVETVKGKPNEQYGS
jgi:hypothetical protein